MNDDLTIVRAYVAPLETGDGRTIVGRCIPFDTPTMVAEPGGEPYREIWRRGAFRNVIRDASRTRLTFQHSEDLPNQIGVASALEETDGALIGTFRALPGIPGDQALELIRAGAVTGLSVSAVVSTRHSRVLEDGTVERSLAKRLEHVALVTEPAYRDAQVLAVRSAAPADTPAIARVRAWRDERALRFASERR